MMEWLLLISVVMNLILFVLYKTANDDALHSNMLRIHCKAELDHLHLLIHRNKWRKDDD